MASPLHDNPRSGSKAKEPEKKSEPAAEEKAAAEKPAAEAADDGEKADAEEMGAGDMMLDQLKALHKTHDSEIKDYFANHTEGARQMRKRHMKAMMDHYEQSRAKPMPAAGAEEVAAAAGDAAAPAKEE